MPRRDFITPSSLPTETQGRCITIPASQEWLGLVNAALLMLTQEWRYEQIDDTALTPEQTAAAAYDMYVQYLGSECAMTCCPLRYNPYTGRIQQSSDGGLTWFDVDNGPWTESLYPEFSALPEPIDDPEPECLAATTAAYVLRNLYDQVGNTLLNYVAATDWEYAGALGSMLTGFFMTIGAAALQPYAAIGTLLGIVGVRQQYVDYPLDDDDEERLKCILLGNATLQPTGAVTFDFQAVWDAIDLDSPKNGLVRFLLTMIGPDALNYAGAIDAGLTADCSPCGTWCRVIDFEIDDGGFVNESYSWYESGVGWRSGIAPWNASAVRIKLDFADDLRITRLRFDYEIYGSWETGVGGTGLKLDGSTVYSKSAPPTGIVNSVDSGGIGPITADEVFYFMEGFPPSYGQIIVKKCTLWGEGIPPEFGEACPEESE